VRSLAFGAWFSRLDRLAREWSAERLAARNKQTV